MKIEGEILRWIPPRATNSEPTYYKSTYTVTGSFFELDDFQKYIDNYKPNKANAHGRSIAAALSLQ